jgi:poly(A) polymerase
MSHSLGQPSWLAAPRTLAVMDALEAAGGADCARFVGGCVRNALIGQPVADIDIATRLSPKEVIAALEAAKLKAVPTGVEHGTVTAVSQGQPFEITTLRRDVLTDGRRAVVAFTDDWGEDARRRDFTLNALYAGRDGTIFDPSGHGVADARAGRIVFVGEPEARLREDYLRILRFFRFLAWYGLGPPDAAALAACVALKDQIATLSAERISKEVLKLLAAPDPRATVALMARTEVLAQVLPAAPDLARFEGLVAIGEADPLLRLAALLRDDPQAAAGLAGRLRLSNAERDRLIAALTPQPEMTPSMSPPEIRRALYRLGVSAFRDRVRLTWAAEGLAADAPWRAMIALSETWTPPVFPLGGEDAIAAGAPRGPMVGQALREVEAWWIDGDFVQDRSAALEKLKLVVRGLES